MSSISTVNDFG